MTVRSSTWEGHLVSASEVAKQTKVALLGLYADQASLAALSAEVIRVALWVQSVYRQTASFSDAAVTTRNLLELARTLWTPIQDAYQDGAATSKIKRMARIAAPQKRVGRTGNLH